MAKPTPLSGFPELLPEQRFVEQQVIDTLRRTFEMHGFAGIETRAVEPLDQLLRKGDTSKEVYLLRRLHEESAEGHAGIGLHFDLTVPFARYVLENAGKLEFPFRRYQIQKAWRGERPQEGRFREFTQADIDIVGRDELPFHHDVEVTRVMVDALTGLTFLPGFRLQVNNRKLIQGFYAGLGIEDPDEVMRLVDKLDKVPAEKVREMLLAEAGIDDKTADRVLSLATIRSTDDSFVDAVRALGVEHDLLDEGLAELAELVALVRGPGERPGPGRGRPLDRARARLLHRHRLRDPSRRLRVDGLDLLRRPLRRPRLRRPDDLPRRRHLARRQPRRRTPDGAHRAHRVAQGAERRTGRDGRRGVARGQRRRRKRACVRAASRVRSRPVHRSSASRSGTPSAEASPTSGSPATTVTRSRTSDRGSRWSPIRTTWTPPEEDLRPQVVSTSSTNVTETRS